MLYNVKAWRYAGLMPQVCVIGLPMSESAADEAARKIPGAWVEACDARECELDRQRRAIVARLGLLPLQMSDVARRATTDA